MRVNRLISISLMTVTFSLVKWNGRVHQQSLLVSPGDTIEQSYCHHSPLSNETDGVRKINETRGTHGQALYLEDRPHPFKAVELEE